MNTESVVVITIDGPSGAGKGTLSQLVAKRLGYHLLDSGALYRLVALSAYKLNVNLQDEQAVADVASKLDVKFDVTGDTTKIFLAGENVTDAIRQEAVSMNASVVAAYPKVRAALLQRQKDFAQAPGLVADGRDMGTTVFPQAQVKVFLTASAEARAERRFKQLQQKGVAVNMEELVKDIKARDDRDTQRATSPLKPADDAVILDSTSLTIEQVLNAILAYVR
ncbi:cytidylate kinase [Cellvibrio zantedeschiae]|uniref:Cytidylate kinase n=1 Tax=Cellvibrio zantedeschiae TaxID=1237077 RepID=A0ABQ3B0S3_9GAMM|nr:(d)CMP kinase [Cellvibrio zantedeschiae]GGY72784.1 cytidylate kinase [Cellvibrio zantedeschiae]